MRFQLLAVIMLLSVLPKQIFARIFVPEITRPHYYKFNNQSYGPAALARRQVKEIGAGYSAYSGETKTSGGPVDTGYKGTSLEGNFAYFHDASGLSMNGGYSNDKDETKDYYASRSNPEISTETTNSYDFSLGFLAPEKNFAVGGSYTFEDTGLTTNLHDKTRTIKVGTTLRLEQGVMFGMAIKRAKEDYDAYGHTNFPSLVTDTFHAGVGYLSAAEEKNPLSMEFVYSYRGKEKNTNAAHNTSESGTLNSGTLDIEKNLADFRLAIDIDYISEKSYEGTSTTDSEIIHPSLEYKINPYNLFLGPFATFKRQKYEASPNDYQKMNSNLYGGVLGYRSTVFEALVSYTAVKTDWSYSSYPKIYSYDTNAWTAHINYRF